ncbi:cation diffusion facilitator family transporter [Bartonella sp. DGB2]|uniref:cation diffusion facilitator family transporter n=1 Tax=Bartonella sp. DGB2 TaxID=3388426 RepID=UPI00398FC4D0
MSYELKNQAEQAVLKRSIFATLLLAGSGIIVGLAVGSSAIAFDGMFGAVDCIFSFAAFMVIRLIQMDSYKQVAQLGSSTQRFQNGFWHLEPLLLALNSFTLVLAVSAAFVSAVSTLWHGGHSPHFGSAVWFAIYAAILAFSMAVYEARRNRRIGSSFIDMDIKSWLISGAIALALALAFGVALIIKDTRFSGVLPFIDSSILALIALCLAPLPIKSFIAALREVLIMTPPDLDQHIRKIVSQVVDDYGFVEAQTYIAKIGRSHMVEIHFILPPSYAIGTIEWIDNIRTRLGAEIGNAGPDRWLTVSFTAQPEWAY